MKIGITLGLVNPKLWVELTEEADRLGYESVWLPEHLVLPVDLSGTNYPGTESGTPPIPPNAVIHDVFSATGFLAGRTSSIR